MAVCPTCKIEVEEKKARGQSTQKDETYFFCSKACKKKFDEEPEKYIKK
jgi:YHS domain-containing protein